MNKEKTKKLIEVMQAFVDGKEIEEGYPDYANYYLEYSVNADPKWNWEKSNFRIKPEKKIIDLSVAIESGVDCEFSDEHFHGNHISKLRKITSSSKPYSNTALDAYKKCRIRQSSWHFNNGGKCPIPNGLKVLYKYRCGATQTVANYSNKSDWGNNWDYKDCNDDFDIISFKVLGTDPNYRYEWEEE